MKKTIPFLLLAFSLTQSASASLIIQELTLFNYTDTIGYTLEDGQLGYTYSNFADEGLGVDFSYNLDSNNLGTFGWTITNTTSTDFSALSTAVYLDAEIHQHSNSFTNESGYYVGNTEADSWEIDEPGFIFGDLLDNLYDGATPDNTNGMNNIEDDTALALGFYLPELKEGEFFELSFEISDQNIGGLYHYDVDGGLGYYFNGSMHYSSDPDGAYPDPDEPVTVSEPGILGLFAISFIPLLLRSSRRTKSTRA
ncbi:hypothetical protein [Saccharospirillum salsuginis]|uniref:PEP-CTERM protein-sorting domain-containing protein n=1 Tax=Saccharospirillum salsuginis TaxID=418750 RepID=A0A918KU87_9GAMM|nr:hypothetical protein [Saccharospirillum salsuginis]GGX73732.1 hypothetical protein GCM10007392_46520 [Saccharospirillum salsuginis]